MSEIKKNMLRERAERMKDITDEQWNSINLENRRFAEEFLSESTQLSPQTLTQYRSGLRIFFWWIHETYGDKKLIHQIKKKDFLRFQNMLVRRGMSSSGVKSKRSCISSLCKYLINFYEEEEDFLTFRNFVEGVPNPTLNKTYEKIPISEEESQKIIQQLTEDQNWQILALYYMMYISGCRRSEVVQLRKEILNAPFNEKNQCYYTHKVRCKGSGVEGEIRPLMFNDQAKEYINKWFEIRGEDHCEYIFATKYKGEVQQLSIATVNYWFKEIISDIVGRRVNPHITRATRSTDILKSGGDIKTSMKLLGHKSSETTSKFYDLREDEEDFGAIF